MRDLSTDLDRFKFNLVMVFGLFWIVLSGGCTAWFLFGAVSNWLNNRPSDGLVGIAFILGSIALLPGMLAWRWGKLRAGYDPSRDLRNPLWRLPEAIGVTLAIGSWIAGAQALIPILSEWFDGSCARSLDGCVRHFSNGMTIVLFAWLPSWLLFRASRP